MTDQTTIEPPLAQQLSRVDAPLERKRVGDMVISQWAGLTFNEYREAIEFAKIMATGRNSIPGYLKGNNGDCLAVITQALRWHLEPYWVAQHSYVAKAEALITYDSAVHNAIILASGLLKQRPRYHFSGEGEDRVCTVSATFHSETEALAYSTPPIKQCRPPKNQEGVIKGSPLWVKDPDQQLGYYAIRNWGRRYMPEVLGGVYDRDEFGETTQDETDIIPPSPNLLARLPGKMEGPGFQADVVDKEIAAEVKAATEQKKPRAAAEKAVEQPSENPAPVEDKPIWQAPLADVDLVDEDINTAHSASRTSPPHTGQPLPQPHRPISPHTPPQNAEQYQSFAMAWIEKHTDPDEIEARWEGQMDMRRDLKVPLPMRKQLEAAMKARLNTLRGK
jgi:hypothetical protein